MRRRAVFGVIAAISAVVGASSLDPRHLYDEMYPVETIKRHAFHLCGDADPTFVRAVKVDREQCLDGMPHLIGVALGRVRPDAALAVAALLDPSRQAELLLTLAGMPPRQPVTVPRSFANTAWLRTLSSGCADKPDTVLARAGPRAPAGSVRAAALDSAMTAALPPLPRTARIGAAAPLPLPVIPLAEAGATGQNAGDSTAAPTGQPVVADLGDHGPAAIVPLPTNCGGA